MNGIPSPRGSTSRPRSEHCDSRTGVNRAGMQRHRDQSQAAEHHIDADQQPLAQAAIIGRPATMMQPRSGR
jgi:hypothetical protein